MTGPTQSTTARRARAFLAICGLGLCATTPLSAQDTEAPALRIELNRADTLDDSCRLTFLVENGTESDIAALTVETVLIDRNGIVDRLTLFEFGALPAGTPRVRQFDLPDLDCGDLGSVLINGMGTCEGESCGVPPAFSSRTDIDLLG